MTGRSSSVASQGEGEATEVWPRPVSVRMLRHVHGLRQRAGLCIDRQRFTPTYRLARTLMGAGR